MLRDRSTPAQARLATRLARGDSVEAAAQEAGIALATARNQLKTIFQKTGTQSRSEAVALALRENLVPSG